MPGYPLASGFCFSASLFPLCCELAFGHSCWVPRSFISVLSSVRGCDIHYDFADSLDFWCWEQGITHMGQMWVKN
jgi:hypothetical protein